MLVAHLDGPHVQAAFRNLGKEFTHDLGKRAPNARAALKLLYRNPMVSAADLSRGLSISTPTANALVKDFLRLGILRENTGLQRGRVYVFDRYLRLFIS